MQKQGKVNVVAKTGGIKFEGDDAWYNPIDSLKANITPALRGLTIQIDLNDKNKFSTFKMVNNSPNPPNIAPAASSTQATKPKSKVIVSAEPSLNYQKAKIELEVELEYGSMAELDQKIQEYQKQVNNLAVKQLKELVGKVDGEQNV